MIKLRYRTHSLSVLLALFMLGVLAGCTTSVEVEGTIPTPLVNTIPANIGIHYSNEFKTFQYKEVLKDTGTWKINLGKQNLRFFQNLLTTMFNSVEEVPEPPYELGKMQHLDGVIVPKILKYEFATPQMTGFDYYATSILYQILLFDRGGEVVVDWEIWGYGRADAEIFGAGEAIGSASMTAIRDGGAKIAIGFSSKPAVKEWLQKIRTRNGN